MFDFEDDAMKILAIFLVCFFLFGTLTAVAVNFAPDRRSDIESDKFVEMFKVCEQSSLPMTCQDKLLNSFRVR